MRTFDIQYCNEIFNHPEVYPYAVEDGRPESLDITSFVTNTNNIFLRYPGGMFSLMWEYDNTYQLHTLFTKSGRPSVKDYVLDGLVYMFTETDCETMYTRIPTWNKAARLLAEWTGFRKVHTESHKWLKGDKSYPVDTYVLRYEDWVVGNDKCLAEGNKFHTRLHEQLGFENHPDCPVHNSYAGSLALSLTKGAVTEGLRKYNKWAKLHDYYLIQIINDRPLILDIGDCYIKVEHNEFEVLKWVM